MFTSPKITKWWKSNSALASDKTLCTHRMPCTATSSSGCQHERTEIMFCLTQITESKKLSPRIMGFKTLILYYLRRSAKTQTHQFFHFSTWCQRRVLRAAYAEQGICIRAGWRYHALAISCKKKSLIPLSKGFILCMQQVKSNIKVHVYAQCQE